MKLVILGCSGLIGHKLFQVLGARFERVTGVLHGDRKRFESYKIFSPENTIENLKVEDTQSVFDVLEELEPDVILNCAGITRRREEISDLIRAISVNALFPHLLARWAKDNGVRVLHFSTDCVFDGKLGNYSEESPTTPEDFYGHTKALGEIRYDHSLTIRSSFVGQELAVHSELLDWFLQQKGKKIGGFTNAMYSGISTTQMARVVGDIIEFHPELNGLYNLAMPQPISKYDLLCLARDAYELDVEVTQNPSLVTNPTLDGSKLRNAIQLELPDWKEMMVELAAQRGMYRF